MQMKSDAIEMRYLLGKLSASEAERLEQRSFADDTVFDDIEIAEDELIDAYVRDRLSAEDRKQFETRLLSSKRIAERVEFARLLSTSGFSLPVDTEPKKAGWWASLFNASWMPNSAISGAVAGVFLLLVLGIPGSIAWMQLRNESKRLDIERAAIEQQKQQLAREIAERQSKTDQLATDLQNANEQQNRLQQQLQALEEQLARQTGQPGVSAAATVLLFPFSSRSSGQPNELIVSPSTASIRLKLALEADDYNSYQVTVESSTATVLTQQGLRSRRSGQDRILSVQFPSQRVSSGDYVVKVSGRTPGGTYEPVADYRVRVSKK